MTSTDADALLASIRDDMYRMSRMFLRLHYRKDQNMPQDQNLLMTEEDRLRVVLALIHKIDELKKEINDTELLMESHVACFNQFTVQKLNDVTKRLLVKSNSRGMAEPI